MEPNEVVNALMTGRYDEIHDAGDAHFQRSIQAKEIRRVWQAMTSNLREPKGVMNGVVLHDLGLAFADGDGHVQIAYRDGKITGLVLRPGRPSGQFGD